MNNTKVTSTDSAIQDVYLEALQFAALRHAGQMRASPPIPYVTHLCCVAMEITIAAAHTESFDLKKAVQLALLHDVLEDTDTPESELAARFGKDIADGVRALTKNEALPKDERMMDSLTRIKCLSNEVAAVKLADRINNLDTPPPHWSSEKIKAYYHEAILIYTELHNRNSYLANRLRDRIKNYETYFTQM